MLQATQIGLNTADMSASLRLYAEAFGFANAGAQALWGNTIAIQGLGPESRALMWWMVGAQPMFQLELFQHAVPAQRPLPADWRPSDHGWVRWGVAVTDFDATLAALVHHGIPLLAPPSVSSGTRHAAIRDPHVGVVVDVIEQSADARATGPEVRYMSCSVADIDAARAFWGGTLGLEIAPLERLHTPADETAWGLPGAQRDGFLARAGSIWLEILQYHSPAGRPQPADHRISDQGIMNIMLGSRERADVAEAFARLKQISVEPPFLYDDSGVLCGYIIERGREVEIGCLPAELDAMLGFTPTADFLR